MLPSQHVIIGIENHETLAHLVELPGVIVLYNRPAVRDVATVVLDKVESETQDRALTASIS